MLGTWVSCAKTVERIRMSAVWDQTRVGRINLAPDLQNISRQSYDCLTIMPKLRSTYDGRIIYKTAYNERKGLDSRAKS